MESLRQHEEEQREKDYQILKKLEDAHRLETNVLARNQLAEQIQNLKKTIKDREANFRYKTSKSSYQPIRQEMSIDDLAQQSQLLQVSSEEIEQVKLALNRLPSVIKAIEGANREIPWKEKISLLAQSIQPFFIEESIKRHIQKFFDGKPVKRDIFIKICSQLYLDWQKILDLDFLDVYVNVVKPIRKQRHDKIKEQCGTLDILDFRPIGVKDLYVEVNILDDPIRYTEKDISALPKVYDPKTNKYDPLSLGQVDQVGQKRMSGLEAAEQYSKLMVSGKPGSGKTTFLKYLAIQCNQGDFEPDHVPIFIRLKRFAEESKDKGNFSLLHYISEELKRSSGAEQSKVERLLGSGKAIILLDGLDEVSEKDSDEVIQQIEWFREDYFKSQFIVTCRIAAKESKFPGFEEVEIADFNSQQIEDFAQKWFTAGKKEEQEIKEGKQKAAQFIEKLNNPKNEPIRAIAVTPILLTLTCLVFQRRRGNFPAKRSELYQRGIKILLTKWNESKRTYRDEVYRKLPISQKTSILTYIANITFEKERYFFKEDEIKQHIADYLLASNHPDPETLEQDSEAVLKAIEVQHGLLVERANGIYSFSHLTFHEYFQAKAFIANFEKQDLPKIRRIITKKSWREVLLLAADMQPKADNLLRMLRLMKQAIDELIAPDDKLQQFLAWVNLKSQSAKVPSLPAAVRAFYFNLVLRDDPSLVFALDSTGVLNRDPVLDRERNLVHDLALALARDLNFVRTASFQFGQDDAHDLAYKLAHDLDVSSAQNLGLTSESLQQLKEKLPTKIEREFEAWWQSNGEAWTEKVHALTRNLGSACIYALDVAYPLAYTLARDLDVDRTTDLGLDSELKSSLQQLKEQLPNPYIDKRGFDAWWQSNGEVWTEQLRSVMIKHRNIGHDWQFSSEQKQLLKSYYNANSLLVECMNIASHITPNVREAIESSLLGTVAKNEAKFVREVVVEQL